MSTGQKKTADLNEAFQFKMVFLTRNVQNCLKNADGIDKCESEAVKLAQGIVENLLKQIDII